MINVLYCSYDGSLFQSNGSTILQPGQQLSAPLQLQQRHESLEDRHKASAASSNDVKPLVSSIGQSSAVHLGDASMQKVNPFSTSPFSLYLWVGPVWIIFIPLSNTVHLIAIIAVS